ncbi:MAG: MBOAT family protein [Clostridia bacterium]|nr:MBOAT family protein [Clostridia bacterium]
MVFSSTLFLFIFLPIVLIIYYLIPKKYVMLKNIELLIASMIFYAWGERIYVGLMIISIAANYVFGLLLELFEKRKQRLAVVIISVIFNLGLLFFFKYINFFTNNAFPSIVLPIGISFFTFQIMSYTIDVYWGNVKTQRNIFNLALYLSLFPQLIAGPIVRYIDVEREIGYRTYTVDSVYRGVCRFTVGLAKKVVISNTVALLADTIFAFPASGMSAATAWLGAIAYTLQIYFDFSGYSDMAIGMGHMMGFNFLENFNYPYISRTVQEFWRRWHMSLSTWFKDYLYIPLGGNRKGKIRTYINLIIVFACTGFWHGAAWNFLVWGLYHGFFQIVERLGLKKILEKIPRVFGHIYTILVFIIGWVLFRAESLQYAWDYVKTMFSFHKWGWLNAVAQLDGDTYPGTYTFAILVLGIILSMPIVPALRKKIEAMRGGDTAVALLRGVGMVVLLGFSILCLTGSDYNPFIYFRF